MNIKDKKIAIVHDFLNQYGGAEKVLEVLCEIFLEAPIYTLLYDKKAMRSKFSNREIHTSFLQKLPGVFRRRFKILLPILPTVPETFDLRNYDLVISSSGAWSKGIVTKLDTIHIAYIHSPMRFVWDYNEKYLKEERKGWLTFFIRPVLSYLRLWDKLASDRPDYLIANSRYTQSRINKYYRRESAVIYPPVFIGHSERSEESNNKNNELNNAGSLPRRPAGFTSVQDDISKKYFLIVSRLSPYKKIDKAIEAFNKLELPLVIVGTGKQEKYLKKIAKENIKFLGFQKDEDLAELYKNARAFIFPGVDDFGMAPVEAMMHGVPVIAIKEGGAVEIIEEGKTGEFSQSQKAEVIADAVRRFCENEKNYDKEYISKSVERFSKERFKRELLELLSNI